MGQRAHYEGPDEASSKPIVFLELTGRKRARAKGWLCMCRKIVNKACVKLDLPWLSPPLPTAQGGELGPRDPCGRRLRGQVSRTMLPKLPRNQSRHRLDPPFPHPRASFYHLRTRKRPSLLHRQYRRQEGQAIRDLLSPSQARSLFLFFLLSVAFSPMTTSF